MAAIYDWPEALRPASVEWGLIVPQTLGRSAFDGSVQAQTQGAPRWAFSITTGVMKSSEVPEWEGFLQLLRGMVNRVRVWDWRREALLGTATGTPTVRFASVGNLLDTHGWGAGGLILPGTYFAVNGELKRLSVTAGTDGLGQSMLTFEPPLRATAPAAAVLTLTKPKALFVMTSERVVFGQQGARHTGATLSFEEVFA